MYPVGYALDQLVLLAKQFILFHDGLSHLLEDVRVVLRADSFACEDMHDLLDVELILLLAAYVLYFWLCGVGFFQAHFRELFFELIVSFLVGVEEEYFEEEVEQVDDGVGIGEDLVVGVLLFGDVVGLAADPSFELSDVYELEGEDHVGDEEVEEFFLYFGVY
jgi:hypothetical protein